MAEPLIWHPHQKLWNWRLVNGLERRPGGRRLAGLVVQVDTLLLVLRVLARRGLRRPKLPPAALYVDCGLHRDGLQAASMLEWFSGRLDLSVIGYEASADHYADVTAVFADRPVDFRREALVGPEHAEATVRLYKGGGNGEADSLFAARGSDYETVPAVRLSDAIGKFFAAHPPQPVIVRMNIEGAEAFVIDDLLAAGTPVSGYYGMWDDLAKIDPARDRAFRSLLRERGIRPVTFNDRDYRSRLRLWAIRYDITTRLSR